MSALRKLSRTRTDGSDLLGANAGITAGMPCSWQKREYAGCHLPGYSRGSSMCELIQQTWYKPVERVDYVGENATAVACDHPRSWRKSICRGVRRSRGFHQKMKSNGYERGRSPRNIHDKKSILYKCLHVTAAIVCVRRNVQPESCG
jgi:hypothetical protein